MAVVAIMVEAVVVGLEEGGADFFTSLSVNTSLMSTFSTCNTLALYFSLTLLIPPFSSLSSRPPPPPSPSSLPLFLLLKLYTSLHSTCRPLALFLRLREFWVTCECRYFALKEKKCMIWSHGSLAGAWLPWLVH